MDVTITVNGHLHDLVLQPSTLLVHVLREELALTGTHVGCDTSHCGACTVVMDGKAVKSCNVLAPQADGRAVTTVEGLSDGSSLGALQQAFADNFALQCGFCTSGLLMAAHALLESSPSPDENAIRQAISGNLCRCTGYQHVVDAVRSMAEQEAS